MTARWDVIVIGAGPAGMSATATLAERGLTVLLLEQNEAPGGQIYRNLGANIGNAKLMTILGADYARGRPLLDRLNSSRARLGLGQIVWRVDPNGMVWTKSAHGIDRFAARCIIIATGAMERPLPVPGWTLPGVMSIGALQIMLKSSALVPEADVILAGTGPLLYLYAVQCLRAGQTRVTILDTQTNADRWRAARLLPEALRGRGSAYLWKGIGLLRALQSGEVRIHKQVSGIAIDGAERVSGVSFDTPGGRLRYATKLVALHEGILPNVQITRAAGCHHLWDDADHAFRPALTTSGETSVSSVFVAGDGGGIIGAAASAYDGERIALAVAARLGKLDEAEFQYLTVRLNKAKAAELAARPFINALYHPGDRLSALPDHAILCRCEALRTATIRDSIAVGASGPDQVKAFTRAGMGPCQGRMCGPSVNRCLVEERQVPEAEAGYFNIRWPIVPIPASFLGDYAKENLP